MATEYLKPVRHEVFWTSSDDTSYQTIDTHGLMARMRVSGGNICINTGDIDEYGYNYYLLDYEEFCFCGKLNFKAKDGSAFVYVLYFDAV